MTDNEIIKALECCRQSSCKRCPYLHKSPCNEFSAKDALDLINRQKAEIERLSKQNLSVIEHLKKARKQLKTAKAEAYKEFAERLKSVLIIYTYQSFDGVIDNLLKELVGEDK